MGSGCVHYVGPAETMTSGPTADVSGTVAEAIAPEEVLTLRNARGSIRVTGTDREDVEARYTITVFADDETTAARYAEELKVAAVRRPDGVQLELVRPARIPAGVRAVAVSYQIAVPRSVRVRLENAGGPVEVSGVAGPSSVENGFGTTSLRNLEGDWTVRTRFGELWVNEVRGRLELSGTYTEGWIANVAGPVAGDFVGSLTVEEAESVELDASYTQLRLFRIHGPIGLSMAFGPAELDWVRHDVRVKGSYGNLTVRLDPAASGFHVDVESHNGEIRNESALLRGRDVVQDRGTSQLKAVVGDGAHVIQVSLRNGHVTVR